MDELLKRRRNAIAQYITPYTPTQHTIKLRPYSWVGRLNDREVSFNVDNWSYGCDFIENYDPEYYTTLDLSQSSSQVYYKFKNSDIAAIPSNAVISSVTCEIMAGRSNNKVRVYATLTRDNIGTSVGRTAMFTGDPDTDTVGTGGSWTRAQLDSLYLMISAYPGSGYSYGEGMYGKFYGADLYIVCTY